MNRALSPRDRGNRATAQRWTSGHPRPVYGAVGLAHGITNDSKHAVRHAACKNGSLYMGVELNGRGPGIVPVALPGAQISRSEWKLSHRSRDRHAPRTHVRGAMETERVDPSPGALGRPAVFSKESAQKHFAGCW